MLHAGMTLRRLLIVIAGTAVIVAALMGTAARLRLANDRHHCPVGTIWNQHHDGKYVPLTPANQGACVKAREAVRSGPFHLFGSNGTVGN